MILKSVTYKLRQNNSDHALYFTIVDKDEKVTAMFVNSREMKSYQWVIALMTSYSRQLNAGIDIDLIISDMKETFDPAGPYHPPGFGRMVNSLIHHLGLILERHTKRDTNND